MGLDSVELIVEIEKYFNIQIPDKDVEQVYTIQDLVDVIADHLHVFSNDKFWQEKVFKAWIKYIQSKKQIIHTIHLSDNLSSYLSLDESLFQLQLDENVIITTPPSHHVNALNPSFLKKVVSWWAPQPSYKWEELTVEDFINSICAYNYTSLINPAQIQSKYEIYLAVAGITNEKIIADIFEIKPYKSFSHDLGID